jgi:predicted kinase
MITTLLTTFFGFLGDFFVKGLEAWLAARETDAARADTNSTHERAATAEAAAETQDAISDAADQRAALPPPPDDPAALARELRIRADAIRARGGDPSQGR